MDIRSTLFWTKMIHVHELLYIWYIWYLIYLHIGNDTLVFNNYIDAYGPMYGLKKPTNKWLMNNSRFINETSQKWKHIWSRLYEPSHTIQIKFKESSKGSELVSSSCTVSLMAETTFRYEDCQWLFMNSERVASNSLSVYLSSLIINQNIL